MCFSTFLDTTITFIGSRCVRCCHLQCFSGTFRIRRRRNIVWTKQAAFVINFCFGAGVSKCSSEWCRWRWSRFFCHGAKDRVPRRTDNPTQRISRIWHNSPATEVTSTKKYIARRRKNPGFTNCYNKTHGNNNHNETRPILTRSDQIQIIYIASPV
jgi:hypothetical protein